MSETLQAAVSLALVVLAAVGLPILGMRMLVPVLAAPERMHPNYRGKQVFLGLGVVWIIWALGVALLQWMLPALSFTSAGLVPAVLGSAAWLATVCFALGLVDDAFGTTAEKGLRGHLRALAKGRLTTGGLKLMGIGAASLVAASGAREWLGVLSGRSGGATAVEVVLATVVIAGMSNLLNLLDLRPGRALKAYLVLAFVAWVLLVGVSSRWAGLQMSAGLFGALSMAVALAGPVLAVWRFDLGEVGMLGDAGANPAGAVAGFVFALSLPLWGLALVAALVVAANLASERVSFSALIEDSAVLSRLDAFGRADTFSNASDESPTSREGGVPRSSSDR